MVRYPNFRRVTDDRFTLEEKSASYLAATEHAPLDWLVDFVSSAYEDPYPREGREVDLSTADDEGGLADLSRSRAKVSAPGSPGRLVAAPARPHVLPVPVEGVCRRWRRRNEGMTYRLNATRRCSGAVGARVD